MPRGKTNFSQPVPRDALLRGPVAVSVEPSGTNPQIWTTLLYVGPSDAGRHAHEWGRYVDQWEAIAAGDRLARLLRWLVGDELVDWPR
jgi:hypothetical protein